MARRRRGPAKDKSKPESGESAEKEIKAEEGADNVKVPKKNDPEWYARDPQLLLDAARIPFSYPLGDKVALHTSGEVISPNAIEVDSAFDSNTQSLPGILGLHIVPSVGYANTKTDPINVAATALYAHVRYVNSGRKNYDPCDLMMYCLAMADIYSFIFWCKRVYGQAFVYSQRNKYVGRDLLTIDHVNASSIIQNLANFRYWLNAFINKVQSFAIPADIYYFKRRAFMFSNYYIENGDGNIKDQLYQFTPTGWYRFILDNNNVGMLEFHQRISGNPSTFSDIMSYGESLLQYITGDEDFGLMSGDILKAYEGNIIGLTNLEEDYQVTPVYDLYVLEQFHNAIIAPVYKNDSSHNYVIGNNTYRYGNVYQSADGLLLSREANYAAAGNGAVENDLACAGLRVISSELPEPDPGYIVEETRLHVAYRNQGVNLELSCGTEIASAWEILYHDNSGNSYMSSGYSQYFKTTSQNGSAAYHWIFKYHPIVHLYNGYVDSNDGNKFKLQVDLPVSNIDNYAIIDAGNIAKLHEVSLLSLFFVPGVARLVNFAG